MEVIRCIKACTKVKKTLIAAFLFLNLSLVIIVVNGGNGMRRNRRAFWALVLCVILCACLIGAYYWSHTVEQEATLENGWELILVNSRYTVPQDYAPNLLTLSNGEQVDERIYPALQAMFDDAREEGVYPYVTAGYRTHEEQQRLMDERISYFIGEGYSEREAARQAESWVARPGHSEHELGIAVDINADSDEHSSQDVYAWLAENAYKYGFICRYPEKKSEITGISNEPWHYRYVGKSAAQEMFFADICLEEYLAQ